MRPLGLLSGALAVALAMALASGSSAKASEFCSSYTNRYFLGSGSAITLRLGFVDTVLNVCRDGSEITSATASQTVGTTGPGTTLGFSIDPGSAVVKLRTPVQLEGKFTGRLRTCIVKEVPTPICSKSYDYSIGVGLGGPTIGDPRRPTWFHAVQTADGVHYYGEA